MTYWYFNENQTEKVGHIYLINNFSTYEYDKKRINKDDIVSALGLQIQVGIRHGNENIVEITKVTRGSIADTYGQLQIGMLKVITNMRDDTNSCINLGDQILEWNGEKLTNTGSNDINHIISQSTIDSPQIHMVVKRSIEYLLFMLKS